MTCEYRTRPEFRSGRRTGALNGRASVRFDRWHVSGHQSEVIAIGVIEIENDWPQVIIGINDPRICGLESLRHARSVQRINEADLRFQRGAFDRDRRYVVRDEVAGTNVLKIGHDVSLTILVKAEADHRAELDVDRPKTIHDRGQICAPTVLPLTVTAGGKQPLVL